MVGVNLAWVGDWATAQAEQVYRWHAIDRGRNFVGFEEIFARRRQQRSGGHCVHICAARNDAGAPELRFALGAEPASADLI
jgi:hypothetical protein